MDDQEKIALGMETFVAFCDQFGDDPYSQILLEELFEGVMNEETVFVFGEQEQDGWDQAGDCTSIGDDSDEPCDGSEDSEAAADLGEEDRPDYP
jgi:hypothetical protein